jgi:hypothetical protein
MRNFTNKAARSQFPSLSSSPCIELAIARFSVSPVLIPAFAPQITPGQRMATTDYLAVPTANIPTAHLASIICAALRVINSSIGHLPAHDMRTVLPLLRHTNAITSHAIRRFGVTTPKARGVDEILSDVGRLEGDAQEVADLSAYLDALSANGQFDFVW